MRLRLGPLRRWRLRLGLAAQDFFFEICPQATRWSIREFPCPCPQSEGVRSRHKTQSKHPPNNRHSDAVKFSPTRVFSTVWNSRPLLISRRRPARTPLARSWCIQKARLSTVITTWSFTVAIRRRQITSREVQFRRHIPITRWRVVRNWQLLSGMFLEHMDIFSSTMLSATWRT